MGFDSVARTRANREPIKIYGDVIALIELFNHIAPINPELRKKYDDHAYPA
jgi:hypothetical protein